MKKLGQHFLADAATKEKILQAIQPGAAEVVVEIGPGHGELTRAIRRAHPTIRIIAIEKDTRLAGELQKVFDGDEKTEIIEGDALAALPEVVDDLAQKGLAYQLIGNLPYYITGQLLRLVGELEHRPRQCVFMLQKEVAERVAAAPPKMNKLAAATQFWSGAKVIFTVGRSKFNPPPKVDSAVIVLTTAQRKARSANTSGRSATPPAAAEGYYRILRAAFQQPRKTLANNLKTLDKNAPKKLEKLGFSPKIRPQDLSVADIAAIADGFPIDGGDSE